MKHGCVISNIKPGLWFRIVSYDEATKRGVLCGAMGEHFDADLSKETLIAKNYRIAMVEFDANMVPIFPGPPSTVPVPTPVPPPAPVAPPVGIPVPVPAPVAPPTAAYAPPTAEVEPGVVSIDASDW